MSMSIRFVLVGSFGKLAQVVDALPSLEVNL